MILAKCKVTPENIEELFEDEIFVFGSNLAGFHGAGAARQAMKWGAKYGICLGMEGSTYALPTKDKSITTLKLGSIRVYVNCLEMCIINNPDKHFLITKVGCGLAGYNVEQIAPLFSEFLKYINVSLPIEFIHVNQGVTLDEIEQLAIIHNKDGWGHIYHNGKLMYDRKSRIPQDYWKQVDFWIEGFIKSLTIKNIQDELSRTI